MDPEGGGRADGEAELTSESWYPARRRQLVATFTVLSVLAAMFVVAMLTIGDAGTGWELVQPILWVLYSVMLAVGAWTHSKIRLQADDRGLHLIGPRRTTTYLWEDVAEIRPSILKGKRTFLVLIRRNGEFIDLPVTDEHLDAVRRWQAATT